jgi:signal transduction histidine kinase
LIILPSLVLAYFGINSIKDQEESAIRELNAASDIVSRSFLEEMGSEFVRFEEMVQYILGSGRAPSASLHQDQRIILRFDKDQELISPFFDQPIERWTFHSGIRHDSQVAMPMRKLRMLSKRIEKTSNKEFERTLLALRLEIGEERATGGGLIRHLLDLKRAQIVSIDRRRILLQSLVDDIINTRWYVHDGAQGAIAMRALAELKQSYPSPSKLEGRFDELQLRIDRRIQEMFWTTQWEEEWRKIIEDASFPKGEGELSWIVSNQGLWGQTTWNEEHYIFGLDKDQLIERFEKILQEKTRIDSRIEMHLNTSGATDYPNKIVERDLIFPGWSVVVVQKNPKAFWAKLNQDRLSRSMYIGFSVLCMLFGLFLTFRVASKEVEMANVKSHFAASVSHELRSPITQIRLKGESLLFGLAETEEELEEHYESIVRESERLSWLVDNVLDYAAIERNAKHYFLRPNNVNETVQRVVDSLIATLSMRDVEIEVDLGHSLPLLRHDPDAVSQCVINLLSNAAKYSKEEKYIRVATELTKKGIEISVTDHGIGICEDDLKKIFEPFFRSREESARRRKGTGIGLAITQHIMEAHRGDIHVSSKFDEGSTFRLRFPSELIDKESGEI